MLMNDLLDIYKRIEYLRNQGVKMKEIADYTNMAASVLSSLYSSVLPTYLSGVNKGENEEDVLDYALSQVNNISKKEVVRQFTGIENTTFPIGTQYRCRRKSKSFFKHANRRNAKLGARGI